VGGLDKHKVGWGGGLGVCWATTWGGGVCPPRGEFGQQKKMFVHTKTTKGGEEASNNAGFCVVKKGVHANRAWTSSRARKTRMGYQ